MEELAKPLALLTGFRGGTPRWAGPRRCPAARRRGSAPAPQPGRRRASCWARRRTGWGEAVLRSSDRKKAMAHLACRGTSGWLATQAPWAFFLVALGKGGGLAVPKGLSEKTAPFAGDVCLIDNTVFTVFWKHWSFKTAAKGKG